MMDSDEFGDYPTLPPPNASSPDRGMVLPEAVLRSGEEGEEMGSREGNSFSPREDGGDTLRERMELRMDSPRARSTGPVPVPVEIEQGGDFFVKRTTFQPSSKENSPSAIQNQGNDLSASASAGRKSTSKSRGAVADVSSLPAPQPAADAGTSSAGLAAIASKYRRDAQALEEARRRLMNGGGAFGVGAASAAASSREGGKDYSGVPNAYSVMGQDSPSASPARGGRGGGEEGASPSPKPGSPRVVTSQRLRAARGPQRDAAYATQMQAVWRQHVDRLYDFYAQHFLEYPTSTVAFVPESRVRFPAEYAMHQVYTGTVAPRDNYVCAHHIYVPSELEEEDKEEALGDDGDGGDGDVGKYTDVANLMQPVLRVAHEGPVSRLRVNPFIPSLIAARGRRSTMSIYQLADYSVEDVNKPPTTTLRGVRQAGHGLAWHTDEPSLLAASSNDGMVYVFDVNANLEVTAAEDDSAPRRTGASTGPIMGLVGHQDIAYDVSWHPTQHHTLMSCDAAGKIFFWDTRSMSKEFSAEVHSAPVLSCAYHPTAIFALATAGADGLVRVWDMRKLNRPTYSLVGHRGPVLGVRWAPFNNTVLLSHSADSSVALWDLSKVDTKPIDGVDDFMRPELLFQHFGHMGTVRDAQWCDHPEDPWTVASVDDYNTVQLWSPAPNAYNNMRVIEED